MTARGRLARGLEFARSHPRRAVVQIPVEGRYQAHSWDLGTGAVVTATRGRISYPSITPDGQWLWWFDDDAATWWRSPFGSSPRWQVERPLRLLPTRDVRILLGGEGTAVVSRPAPGGGRSISLLPVGRMRPGAEPVFLGSYTSVRKVLRSRDDAFIAVDTGMVVEVRSAYTGAPVSYHPLTGGLQAQGFTSGGALVLATADPGPGAAAGRFAARWWNPHTGLQRDLPVDPAPFPRRLSLDHDGSGFLVESGGEGPEDTGTFLYAGAFRGGPLTACGPTYGSLIPGTATAGPGGSIFAAWTAPGLPARVTDLTAAEARVAADGAVETPELHRAYPPAIGGYDD